MVFPNPEANGGSVIQIRICGTVRNGERPTSLTAGKIINDIPDRRNYPDIR